MLTEARSVVSNANAVGPSPLSNNIAVSDTSAFVISQAMTPLLQDLQQSTSIYMSELSETVNMINTVVGALFGFGVLMCVCVCVFV